MGRVVWFGVGLALSGEIAAACAVAAVCAAAYAGYRYAKA